MTFPAIPRPSLTSTFTLLGKLLEKDDLENEELRKARGILGSELRTWMRRTSAQKILMILDTCEAGGMFENPVESKALASDRSRVLQRLRDRTGTYVLAGSAADRFSFESNQYSQGLLTYSLLSGMRGPALKALGVTSMLKA